MLPLKSQLLVSTGTALASWQRQTKAKAAEHDRAAPHAHHVLASLRFVHFLGFWSQFAYEDCSSSWPLPNADAIEALSAFAEEHRVLATRPEEGDVFLLGSATRNRHVRAGIVAGVERVETLLNGSPEFVCTTIEGEVCAPASANRAAPRVTTRFVRRWLSPAYGDDFIRWYELPAEASPAGIVHELPTNLIIFDPFGLRRAA